MFDLVGEDIETISTKTRGTINETAESFAVDISSGVVDFVCECVFELFN